MTFQDIFKSSFLENFASFSALDMAIAMGLGFILSLFIFYVYKKTYNGVMYSTGFGLSLMAMTMITTLVILAVTSNVVLSLGMVGALSIVRFRTAVKEPMDIAFLFWSIAAGIVLGAGLVPLAVFGSLFIGLILVIFANKRSVETPYILVVSSESQEQEQAIVQALSGAVKRFALKSKMLSPSGLELTVEIRLQNGQTAFVDEISRIPGVRHATLVSYNGDYMS
jgi:uncharacterized membrane protein YhiD involved in acid resistance